MPSPPVQNSEPFRLTTVSAKPVPRHAHLRRVTASTSRFLHLYLSMLSFAVVLFFAATGITLNHPDWFSSQIKTIVHHGVAPHQMLGSHPAAEPDNPGNKTTRSEAVNANSEAGVDKLGLVEMLRSREGIHGAVSDFSVDDSQIEISFKAPGYSADAFIDRDNGKYDLTETRNGIVAVMNDLHKGRDSGRAWAWVIDLSAGLLVLVSLTGLILIWFMHKRRVKGLLLAVTGALLCLAMYKIFVP